MRSESWIIMLGPQLSHDDVFISQESYTVVILCLNERPEDKKCTTNNKYIDVQIYYKHKYGLNHIKWPHLNHLKTKLNTRGSIFKTASAPPLPKPVQW